MCCGAWDRQRVRESACLCTWYFMTMTEFILISLWVEWDFIATWSIECVQNGTRPLENHYQRSTAATLVLIAAQKFEQEQRISTTNYQLLLLLLLLLLFLLSNFNLSFVFGYFFHSWNSYLLDSNENSMEDHWMVTAKMLLSNNFSSKTNGHYR